jgi:upstream activation factor subunit UAF30
MAEDLKLPSERKILKQMEKLVPQVDINTMSVKGFIKTLSKQMGVNLKVKKKFIQASLTSILDNMDDDEEKVLEEKPAKKEVGKGNGFNKEKELSPELAEFIGKPMEARPQVVKALWAYFKENDLQNPKDKRIIMLDDRLKAIFNVEQFTMFQMAKYIGAHLHPFTPVNLNEMTEGTKKRKEQNKKRKAADEAKNGPKKRKTGSQPPYHLSEKLTKITGKSILPRPQVVQALWVYIKEKELQNPIDKREILCDDLFKDVMGHSKVTIFAMIKYIGPHILEKADKDEYARQEASSESNQSASKDRVKSEDQTSSKAPVKSEDQTRNKARVKKEDQTRSKARVKNEDQTRSKARVKNEEQTRNKARVKNEDRTSNKARVKSEDQTLSKA